MKKTILIFSLLLLFCVPLFSQDIRSAKFVFAGMGVDPQSAPNGLGMGGIAFPLAESLLYFNDWDVSVLPGIPFLNALNGEGLQFSFKPGVAQRIYSANKLSIWGLVNIGIAAAPSITSETTDVKAAFAYGGFVDYSFGKVGIIAILQNEKNGSPNGFRFIPRIGIRYKFQ